MMRGFLNALFFCSRFTFPGRSAPSPDLAAPDQTAVPPDPLAGALPFFPLVGLVLGLVAAVPAALFPSLGPWLYPLILAWVTRGLHWDGLADLADACGSNATGERFWRIVKDSRIGAFGVMALVFGITGQMVAVYLCLAGGNVAALCLAPAFGRAGVIALGRCTTVNGASFLAMRLQPQTRSRASLAALILTGAALFCLLPPATVLLALGLSAFCLYALTRLAAREGGANGDFHGTMIIAAETALLLAGGL